MKRLRLFLFSLTLLAAATASAQSMFKCVQNGKTTYQADPCPESAKQDTLKAPAAAARPLAASAPPADPTPAGRQIPGEVNHAIEFMSSYQACADAIKIFEQEMAVPYSEWRERHASTVAKVEGDRKLQGYLQERIDAKRNAKAGICRDVGLTLRGKK